MIDDCAIELVLVIDWTVQWMGYAFINTNWIWDRQYSSELNLVVQLESELIERLEIEFNGTTRVRFFEPFVWKSKFMSECVHAICPLDFDERELFAVFKASNAFSFVEKQFCLLYAYKDYFQMYFECIKCSFLASRFTLPAHTTPRSAPTI